MNIGDIIYNRRRELGLTLEEIGNFVGVGKSTVRKWESGYIENMKRDKIALLSEVLKLSPLVFITGEQTVAEPEFRISCHEKRVINAYRDHPEMQAAIDKLLSVPSEDSESNIVNIKFAARTGAKKEYLTSDELAAASDDSNLTDEDL